MNTPLWSLVILAGGKGTRLKSLLPKPLVPVNGTPLIQPIVDFALANRFEERVVIVSEYTRQVAERFPDPALLYKECEPKGTGYATAQALPDCTAEQVLIAQADDSYFYQPSTLRALMEQHLATQADLTIGLGLLEEELPYWPVEYSTDLTFKRLVRGPEGKLVPPPKRIVAGLYAARREWLAEKLASIPAEFHGEFGLPSVFMHPDADSLIKVFELPKDEWAGVNTPEELAMAEKKAQGGS